MVQHYCNMKKLNVTSIVLKSVNKTTIAYTEEKTKIKSYRKCF